VRSAQRLQSILLEDEIIDDHTGERNVVTGQRLRFSASGQRLLRRLAFVSTTDIAGTSPLSSIHHDRIRIDEIRESNKAALTGGRPHFRGAGQPDSNVMPQRRASRSQGKHERNRAS
jgi:hypothetical protein